MVIAQAQKVELDGSSFVLTFAPTHKSLKQQLEAKRAWVEQLATSVAGRPIKLVTKDGEPAAAPAPAASGDAARKTDLRARAKAEPSVQAVLDVFGGEIDSVEEIDK